MRVVEVPFCTSLKALIYRDILNVVRNPLLIKLRFIQTVFIGVYTGGLYYNIDGDYLDESNWRALTGFLFFLSISMLMLALAPVSLAFPIERSVFLKEEGAKLYTTLPYFLSRNIVEIPYSLFFPMLLCLIIYWFVGLSSTASQFFIFYLIVYLLTVNGVSLGLMLGSIITDAKSVGAITPAFLLPIFLLSGFFKNTASLSAWIDWIQYLSPIKYGFAAFVQNEVQFASASNLEQLNLDVSLWLSIGMLFVLAVSYQLISFFFLWRLRARLE